VDRQAALLEVSPTNFQSILSRQIDERCVMAVYPSMIAEKWAPVFEKICSLQNRASINDFEKSLCSVE